VIEYVVVCIFGVICPLDFDPNIDNDNISMIHVVDKLHDRPFTNSDEENIKTAVVFCI
jgi:hypothetical protein